MLASLAGAGVIRRKLSYVKLQYLYTCVRRSRLLGALPCRRFVHPDLARSPPFMRHRCEKLKSLFSEQYVVAILDGFLTLGLVRDAESLFNFYRREGHQFDVEVYNKMLFGWAERGGNFCKERTYLLFDSMEEDGVQPNCQTYAAMLCLNARHNDWESAKELIQEMESEGHQLKHILHKTVLSRDQTEQILKPMEEALTSQLVSFPDSVRPSVESLGMGLAVLDHCGVEIESVLNSQCSYPRVVESLYAEAGGRREEGGGRSVDSVDGEASVEVSRYPEDRAQLHQLFDTTTLNKCIQKQFEIEMKGYADIQSIVLPKETKNHVKKFKVTLACLKSQWKAALTKAIRKDVEDFYTVMRLLPLTGNTFQGPKQFPFLALLPAEVWSSILIDEVMPAALEQPEGLPVHYICHRLGQSAWNKYVILQKKRNGVVDKALSMYECYSQSSESTVKPAREIWNTLSQESMNRGSLLTTTPAWPKQTMTYVGGALLARLLETATIPAYFAKPKEDTVPAFTHVIEHLDKVVFKKTGYIKPDHRLYEFVKKHQHKDKERYYRVDGTLLPMLIPPQPWTSVTAGGYFVVPASFVRCYNDTYQHQLLVEQAENLNAIYDALNYLSSCPWKINTRILNLMIRIFNRGGDKKLEIPSMIPFQQLHDETAKKLKRSEILLLRKQRNESFSLWMDMVYRLSLANHYRNEVFWLPHNMDFRGRVYPIPPHLSHLSSDVGRGLLKFALGYPLGKKGLDWLKIHLVNLHGEKKKKPLHQRLEFANEMMEEIMDSADMPFKGNKWWQSGDEPWQVLAVCMEITDAVRSGDPENFVSHIPVHQDGSCNGLQHYAALGRDSLGARQVSLVPQDRPDDPYAGVAAMVEERRKADAAEGHEIAKLLEGKINRKVVKQTVMTVVYGVTWVGGRRQVEKQLRENVASEHLWECSKYVVSEVFATLNEMFSSAKKIQDWLAASARKVALAGRPMEWQTPIGLPVVQPYHKRSSKELLTPIQGVTHLRMSDVTTPPDTRKQASAMPPNYVHSLDSTHMMLTALHCQRAGITFEAVHDSFWTHACFVDIMNKICREQFVALHNEPILKDLAEFWELKFGGLKYKDYKLKEVQICHFLDSLPATGDFDLQQVLDSTYFFS